MKSWAWALVLMLVTGVASARKKPYRPELDVELPSDRAERQRMRLLVLEPWVGTWTGKLTWTGCVTDGAARVELELGADLVTDGAQILDGVGSFTWGVAGDQLAMIGEGYEASMIPSRSKKKQGATFTLATAGGCVGKGTLTRPSSKIPACDTLRALATIEATCPALPEATRGDDLGLVLGEWRAWTELTGKKKKARAALCQQEADVLRQRILECGGA